MNIQYETEKLPEFKTIMDILDNLGVAETTLQITEKGVTIVATDVAAVCYLSATMNKEAFTAFDAEPQDFTIDTTELKRVIKKCGKGLITIYSKEPNLYITNTNGAVTKDYGIRLIEKEKDSKLPKLSYDETFEVSMEDFREAIEGADGEASTLFKFEEGFLNLTNEAKTRKNAVTIPCTPKTNIVGGKFNPEYLSKAVLQTAIKAKIESKKDYPLRITQESEKSSVVIVVAPRVSYEDGEDLFKQ